MKRRHIVCLIIYLFSSSSLVAASQMEASVPHSHDSYTSHHVLQADTTGCHTHGQTPDISESLHCREDCTGDYSVIAFPSLLEIHDIPLHVYQPSAVFRKSQRIHLTGRHILHSLSREPPRSLSLTPYPNYRGITLLLL